MPQNITKCMLKTVKKTLIFYTEMHQFITKMHDENDKKNAYKSDFNHQTMNEQ